ncbi:MAG: SH3 domain-containing protein [Pseudomonadota bacterium]
MFRLALVIVLAMLVARPAAAQDGRGWEDRLVADLLALRAETGCFGGRTPERVHVLGLRLEGVDMDPITQFETLGRIGEALSRRRINMRVTQADTFGLIAGRSPDMSPARVAEIKTLLARAQDADITLLVQAYRVSPRAVSARVVFWSNASLDNVENTCTPSVFIDIPRRQSVDPLCARLFQSARGRGKQALQFFKEDMGHCPEAGEVDALLAGLDRQAQDAARQACQTAYNAAAAQRSSSALGAFIRQNPNCQEVASARQLEGLLRDAEERDRAAALCQSRFAAIRPGDGAGYRAFAAQNPTCPQAATAIALSSQRPSLPDPEPAPQPPVRAPVCYVDDVRPPDDWLALRTEPSSRSGRRLARLRSGTPIAMLGERSGHWHRVQTERGMVGWVSWQRSRWIAC